MGAIGKVNVENPTAVVVPGPLSLSHTQLPCPQQGQVQVQGSGMPLPSQPQQAQAEAQARSPLPLTPPGLLGLRISAGSQIREMMLQKFDKTLRCVKGGGQEGPTNHHPTTGPRPAPCGP